MKALVEGGSYSMPTCDIAGREIGGHSSMISAAKTDEIPKI